MKTQFKQTINFLLFLLLLQSCKPDDIYIDLSAEAKTFLQFEVGDTFKLKNHQTNEIIILTVTSKKIRHEEDNSPGSWVSFGSSGGDTYIERGEYTFSDVNNCYDGSLSVEPRGADFELKMYLGNCFGNYSYTFDYQNDFFSTINVSGITYSNAYLLKSWPDSLYYSKEKGILKIVDNTNQNIRFSIVE